MAAVNFPNSPSVNDTHTSSGSTWKWDGGVWQRLGVAGPQGSQGVQGAQGHQGRQGSVGIASLTIATSPPGSPDAGDMWWDSDDGDLHLYYNDGNSSQWANINNGPAGAQGAVGAQGAQGHQGVQGATGSGGAAGAQGAQGHQGVQGAANATTINNNADNRVITGSGTANTLNGEANLTFNGNQLFVTSGASTPPLISNTTVSNNKTIIRETSDGNSNTGLQIQKRHSSLHPANYWYGDIGFLGWDGSGYHRAALIECVAEGTPANDNMPGNLRFSTNPGQASHVERIRITKDGTVNIGGSYTNTTGKLKVTGNSIHDGDVTFTGANFNALWDKSKNALILNDNTQLNFGTDEDGDIYHDGSQMIVNNATGTLKVRSNNLQLTRTDNEVHVNCVSGDKVELYYSGNKRLETTSTGANITSLANATSKLHIGNQATRGLDIRIANSGGQVDSTCILDAKDAESSNYHAQIQFHLGASEKARFEGNGNYFRMASGTGGIQFGGDHAATNALDDYEEGSFTPVFNGSDGGGTSRSGTGKYTKIGNLVNCWVDLTNANGSGFASGYMKVTGFPFTCTQQTWSTNIWTYRVGFDTSRIPLFYMSASGTHCNAYYSRDDDTWQPWYITHWDATQLYCRFHITYQA
jgi:hypothetical protein